MFRTIVSRLRRLGALGLMLLLALGAHAATAQTGPTIRDVVVEGNQRIEVATVQNYLTLHAGSAYSAAEADKSLKALFATGLFSDVTPRLQGDTLIVRVVENPVIKDRKSVV